MNIFEQINKQADCNKATHHERMAELVRRHNMLHTELWRVDVEQRATADWWRDAALWEPERDGERSTEIEAIVNVWNAAKGITQLPSTRIPHGYEYCRGCGTWKPGSAFSPHSGRRSGVHSRCKACRADDERARRHRRRDDQRIYVTSA